MIAGWQEKIDAAQRETTTLVDGVQLTRERYGHEVPGVSLSHPCRDCATQPGDFHVVGCCVERCPACGGQAISCDCLDD